MGLFFRRSIKAGPVRLNFSKNGIGWSFGNKFMRIGRTATGRTYISGGTHGVYYRENLTSGKKQAKKTTKANNSKVYPEQEFAAQGCLLSIGIVAIFCSMLFGLLVESWILFLILFGLGIGIILLAISFSSHSDKQKIASSNFDDNDIDLSKVDPKVAVFLEKTDKILEVLNEPLEDISTTKCDDRIDIAAKNNNKGMAFEISNELEKAIECYEQNVEIGYPAQHSYDRLLVLYRKLDRTEDEKRIARKATELFPEETRYLKRLKKLEGTEDPIVLPQMAIIAHPRIIYGDKFEEEILKLPEFDFYSKGTDNSDYYRKYVQQKSLEPIWKIQEHFKQLLDSAKSETDYNNLAGAASIYEQIIAEKYWMPSPYDALIKIYAKAKLKDEEKRVLVYALEHFKQLRAKRLAYVQSLAEKYGANDFLQDRLDNDKKITYFNGVFELYNPFTIIPAWEKRLMKL